MKLSKRLRKWKGNLTTQTPAEYVLTLRADVNGFADEVKALEHENARLKADVEKLRELARDAIRTISCDRCWHERQGNCTPSQCVWDERADSLGIEVN